MIRDDILREECEFPKWFASHAEKPYGILFFNEDDAESHDSNHAVLFPEKIANLRDVLADVTEFYLQKGLTPRIYQPYTKGYFKAHAETLKSSGYAIEMYGNSKFMLLSGENRINQPTRLQIQRLTEWDDRVARDIYLPNHEEWSIAVEKNSIKNENYYLFAGFLGDEIVTLVSFHLSQYNCTRFDYIVTAPSQRGKGYARELLGHVVTFCKKNQFPNCFQWPMHGTSQRISAEAGFQVSFEEEAGVAVYTR